MNIVIRIKLGKTGVKTKADLGDALCDLADRIENGRAKLVGLRGNVTDSDGCAVGTYDIQL